MSFSPARMIADHVSVPFRFRNYAGVIQMAACNGRDQVVAQLSREGWRAYEAPLPLVLCQLIRARSYEAKPVVFIDVGANTGLYSILAALLGVPEIHAFEPVPGIAAILRSNLNASLAGLSTQVLVHQLALADQEGVMKLYLPHQGHGLIETSASLNPEFRAVHSDVYDVETATLDRLLALHQRTDQPAVMMKLDVETCEPFVLQGADQLIRTNRPWIVSEILPSSDLEFFYRWMQEANYRHYALLPPNQIVPSGQIEVSLSCRDHLFLPAEVTPEALLAT